MQTKVKTGLPQIYSIDFQARACTTSRWLCEEIVKGSPRSPLPIATRGCKSKPLAAGASGVSGATSVADATPTEFAGALRWEAICEDSGTTENGRGTPVRFSSSATRSGSAIGPAVVVLISMRTRLSPDNRGAISPIIVIAVSKLDSPRPKLKLNERPPPKPKETGVLAACAAGAQEVWPGFSPRVP